MRKRQLNVIKLSYVVQNFLYLAEFVLLFTMDTHYGCVAAKSSFTEILRGICELFPTELFLISFWWIPRRYMLSSEKLALQLNETSTEPLLPLNLDQTDPMDW